MTYGKAAGGRPETGSPAGKRKPDIVLQTDFGADSGYAAAMYGVIRTADSELNIFDLTHEIRPFDIRQASGMLGRTVPFWPAGTIFVSVVDPGVGTDRRACAARLKNGSCIITPDNGTLTELFPFIEEVRQIDEKKNRFPAEELRIWEKISAESGEEMPDFGGSTFDGRDLFAWCAAGLASGIIGFCDDGIGPAYSREEIVRYTKNAPEIAENHVECEIADVESRFGGIALSVRAKQLSEAGIEPGGTVCISVRRKGELLYEGNAVYGTSFASALPGEPVLCAGSAGGTLFLSLNRGSFAGTYLPELYRPGEKFSSYRVVVNGVAIKK